MTQPAKTPSEPAWQFWLRLVVFFVVLAWIVGAPFTRQILHHKNKHMRAWIMFSGIGLGGMDAKYYLPGADGTRERIEPHEILGVKKAKTPRKRRLRGKHAVWSRARQVCRKLGKQADVRVVARRAAKDGWVLEYDGEENICQADAPKRTRNKKRSNRQPTSKPTSKKRGR